jgi:hypothetical protein|tara:strand:- start:1073 stop:1540 length:468 start_codon:yes stop_codon:yes gene_type:complete
MADFAEIKTSDNIVLRCVVINDSDIAGKTAAEAEAWVASNIPNDPGYEGEYPETYWKQTWLDAAGEAEKRYNGAGPDMYYDSEAEAFYFTDHHYPSWTLNTSNYQYEAPQARPSDDSVSVDEIIVWSESNTRWEKRGTTDLNSTHYWDNTQWVAI